MEQVPTRYSFKIGDRVFYNGQHGTIVALGHSRSGLPAYDILTDAPDNFVAKNATAFEFDLIPPPTVPPTVPPAEAELSKKSEPVEETRALEETRTLLSERGATHGDFTDHARVTQRLKAVIDDELYRCQEATIQTGGKARIIRDDTLNNIMSESLDMILHKIGRIIAGDPTHADHWDDIAGYAKLVSIYLEKSK